MTDIVKILFFCADPDNLPRIRLGKEIHEIHAKIRAGRYRDQIQIISHFAATEDDLREALLIHQPHILHFSGHGSAKDGLALEDAVGKTSYLSLQRLARTVATIPDNLRIVFLNACYSSVQVQSLSEIVDITIGMNDKILDQSAIDFSANFYLGLAFNRNIQRCFDLGVTALVDRSTPQEHIPVLLSRKGVTPSQIRLFSQPGEPVADAQPKSTDAKVNLEIVSMLPKTSNIKVWRYRMTDQNEPAFIAIDEPGKPLTLPETWSQLALSLTPSISNPSRNNSEAAADVFLLLRGNLVENLLDEKTLQNIVTNTVNSTVGNNLYICWSQKTNFQNLYQGEFQAVVDRWFQTILESGAADLIELPTNLGLDQPGDYKILRSFARRSETRRKRMRKLVTNNDWTVVLRPGAVALKKFLTRFAEEDFMSDENNNLAVFYDQRPNQRYGEDTLLKDSRNFERTGNWFISAVNLKDRDLERLWLKESKNVSSACFDGLFEFQGTFEWLYALLRLRLALRLTQETSPNVTSKVLL